jgi:two-component system, OmpR family, sensor histidine kinase QseC
MSLQRRLLLYLLIAAPLVWTLGLWISVNRASHEVNELFDSELIRLARQVQATLNAATTPGSAPAGPAGDMGEADVRDLAIVVWDREGRQLMADREGAELPYRRDASGFVEVRLGDEVWRTYYLQSFDGSWLVAAGQKAMERSELVFDLTASQLVPWLLVLPVLLLAMTWAVRRALAPVRQLTRELADRGPDDLKPVAAHAPTELAPLVGAMNGLFSRIDATLARERRFTADAAHELRTPLAVLRAQWDVVRRASAQGSERADAERRFSLGLDRLDRLVTQLLALSRLDDTRAINFDTPIQWATLVEEIMSDVLPLAEQRRAELACEWPEGESQPSADSLSLPLKGDAHLMRVLLRNLLDNAVRYAPAGSSVVLAFHADRITVENDGPALSDAVRKRLGERFYRPDGQEETGSGLGVSIARRIAELHGLALEYTARADGTGVRATLLRKPSHERGPSAAAT